MTSSMLLPRPTMLDSDDSPRPAPKRTYGRARPASPPQTTDDHRNLFFVPTATSSRTVQSPSKTLLDRLSVNQTSWINSLGDDEWDNPVPTVRPAVSANGAERSTEQETGIRGRLYSPVRSRTEGSPASQDDEVDPEAVKTMMAQLKAQSRGQLPPSIDEDTRVAITTDFSAPSRTIRPAFSSSSLTQLPSSPQREGSLDRHRTITDLEVPAPRKLAAGSSTSSLTALPTTSEPASSPPPRPATKKSIAPRSSPTEDETVPIRRLTGRRVIQSDEESAPDDPSSPSPSRRKIRTTSIHDSDEEEDALPSLTTRRKSAATPNPPQAIPQIAPVAPSAVANEVEGMFDDIERLAKGHGGSRKIKSLNKQEQLQMHKDMAAARRGQMAFPNKPPPKIRPMSEYIRGVLAQDGSEQVDHAPPVAASSSAPNSPSLHTPTDDIETFKTSSPEPVSVTARPGTMANRQAYDLDDDEELSIMRREREHDLQAEKQKKLAEMKERALRLINIKAKAVEEEEDSFVSPRKPKAAPVVAVKIEAKRRGPDARAVLNLTASSTSPAMSRNRQAHLRRAGKPAKPSAARTLPSETFVDFAGRKFDHANLKNTNGGSTPAGQKQGRDRALPQSMVDRQLRESHQDQARAQSRKKEEEWGRVKLLPERQALDTKPLIEMASRAPAPVADDEEEDEEDDDFVPSGEEEDERVSYSGEDEDEGEVGEAEGGQVFGSDEEGNKENAAPPDFAVGNVEPEDGQTPIFKRPKSRPSGRRIDSDDEGSSTPRGKDAPPPPRDVPRTPLEEVHAFQQPFKTPTPGTGMTFGGFGSGPSPGFSQLFGETQAAGPDGFAGLRAPPAFGLLPGVAALPDVNISATQAERDNALIAAELETAQLHNVSPAAEQPKYLNDQGFFTQTKPSAPRPSLTQVSDDENDSGLRRSALAGSSMTSLLGDHRGSIASLAETPSATVKNSAPQPLIGSPTQADNGLRRLRRRASPDFASSPRDLHSPTLASEPIEESNVPEPMNAFTHLMQRPAPETSERPIRSNFVDEQAEESDEDAGWITRGQDDEDDNEEGEDDGYIANLVDDAQVDEAERLRQDAAAAEKARADQAADDVRREQQMKKVTEGQLRKNRHKRGEDFYSSGSDSDDEDGNRRYRSKKRRRKVENDGLEKLEGEENAFKQVYELGLESDEDDGMDLLDEHVVLEDEGASLAKEHRTQREQFELLRKRGRMNAERDLDVESVDLDREIGFDGAGFSLSADLPTPEASDEEIHASFGDGARSMPPLGRMVTTESVYSVSRSIRSAATYTDLAHPATEGATVDANPDLMIASRSSFSSRTERSEVFGRKTESYAQFVQDESQVTRRAAGAPAGVSVVSSRSGHGQPMRPPLNPRMKGTGSSQSGGGKAQARESSSTSSAGSILLSKGGKFA